MKNEKEEITKNDSYIFFALGNLVILEMREEEYVFRESGIHLVLDIHCLKDLGNIQVN